MVLNRLSGGVLYQISGRTRSRVGEAGMLNYLHRVANTFNEFMQPGGWFSGIILLLFITIGVVQGSSPCSPQASTARFSENSGVVADSFLRKQAAAGPAAR